MTLESTIESYLVKRVEALGGICLKGDVPGRRFIDRICILPFGVTIYVECKRPRGGRRRKHQIETIDRLNVMSHRAHFVQHKWEVDVLIRDYCEETSYDAA